MPFAFPGSARPRGQVVGVVIKLRNRLAGRFVNHRDREGLEIGEFSGRRLKRWINQSDRECGKVDEV